MRFIFLLLFLPVLAVSAAALEFEAPAVPEEAGQWMPEETASFSDALLELLGRVTDALIPELQDAAGIGVQLLSVMILFSVAELFRKSEKSIRIAGAAAIGTVLLESSGAMIRLGMQTARQISDYGKLLLPVMTAAMAAQGAVTASGAIYAGTAVFDAVLGKLLIGLVQPGIWMYLALCTAGSALGEEQLRRMAELIKGCTLWLLKGILMIFTTYLAITGVVSGTTDAAALKATRVTISTLVPMVGGVLADASEAVLVSAGLVKNAAGIYGILAILAVFLHPFAKIGIHYLILKVTGAVCGIFGKKELTQLITDYSCAMGILLALTGAQCLMMLVSTVCFMRGML